MEDDSLSRALEDEQQHVDQRLVPTEIVQKRVRTDDTEETCDSSVTDALQDDRVCADRMYPTLNEVPEEEENRVALPLPRLEEGARARNVTGGNSLERREFKQQDVAAAAPKEDATASMESGSLVIASADTPKFKSEQPKKDSQEEFKEPEGVGGASNMEDSNTAAIQNAPEDITDTNSKPAHSTWEGRLQAYRTAYPKSRL
ncbi:expressed unknown protein [Seminavis robusta]|uniref:Uncharacterized protein n=1 Tax=Seminavis robusta TaxID=568900 RepID=A0A9N8EKC4_9STRA|nr:expressed unknown protein [Seminavis robusta]|eukprot:Sro1404_g269740.1 n/a (202) ;mRNA; f:25564-26243